MTEKYIESVTQRLLSVVSVAYTAGCGLNTSNPWGATTSYPAEWLAIYMKNNYQANDPVLQFMCAGRGAINWRDLPRSDVGKGIMDHAESFGFVNGTVFSNVVQGRKCSVSVCHEREALTDAEISVLQEYTTVYGTLRPRPGTTPKDENCLRYLDFQAQGASATEVQSAMNLSARSVAELKKEALIAMEATSLPHAVAVAMEANLI